MEIDPLDAYMTELEAASGSPIQSGEAAAAEWALSGARRERTNEQRQQQLVRNRRYKTLQVLIDKGEYFSEDAMKMRQPTLFHNYIGRFQRGKTSEFAEATPLYERLLHDIDMADAEDRRLQEASTSEEPLQEEPVVPLPPSNRGYVPSADNDFEEEFDTDSEGEDELLEVQQEGADVMGQPTMGELGSPELVDQVMEEAMDVGERYDRMMAGEELPPQRPPAVEELEAMDEVDTEASYQLFVSLMHEKFLEGADSEYYDYSQCDNDAMLCAAEEDIDGEAAYFDDAQDAMEGMHLEPMCHSDGTLLGSPIGAGVD